MPSPEEIIASLSQATLHRSSAGRGGKIVTLVSFKANAPLSPESLEILAKAMRKGLGCGSHVEGDKITLQGSIQDRAEEWLRKKGAKKIVQGN